MTRHPNEERLAQLYDRFGKGDVTGVLELCADDITFHVPGRTTLSGIQTKATFAGWIGQVWAISEGTFREVPYRIVANDHRGVVLVDHYLRRDGRQLHYRVSHIWDIRDGRFVRWEEWLGDEGAFNLAWAVELPRPRPAAEGRAGRPAG